MYQDFFAESLTQAAADLDGFNAHYTFQATAARGNSNKKKNDSVKPEASNCEYDWWDYIAAQLFGWRKQIYKFGGQEVALSLKIPTVLEAVRLWLKDDLREFNTADQTVDEFRQTQTAINARIQDYFDAVYYSGDKYLTALNCFFNSSANTAIAYLAGIERNKANELNTALRTKALSLALEVEGKLSSPSHQPDGFTAQRFPGFVYVRRLLTDRKKEQKERLRLEKAERIARLRFEREEKLAQLKLEKQQQKEQIALERKRIARNKKASRKQQTQKNKRTKGASEKRLSSF